MKNILAFLILLIKTNFYFAFFFFMKQRIVAFACALVLISQITPAVFAQTSPTVGSNLLTNAGFEANGDWKTGFFTGSGSITRVSADKHSGSYSYAIDGSTTTASGQVYGDVRNQVAVSAGSEYLYTAWYKGTNAYLVVKWLDASGRHFASHNITLPASSAWKEAAVRVKAPAGSAKGWVFAQSRNTSSVVYYDDLFFAKYTSGTSVTPTPSPTASATPKPTTPPVPTATTLPPAGNLLSNPGFETEGGWITGFFTGTGSIARVSTDKHAGSYSYLIDGDTASSSGQVYGDVRNQVAVSANSEYVYKAWYKGSNAFMVIKWLDANGRHFASHNFQLPNTTAWKEAVVKATAPAGTAKGWVFVQSRYHSSPVLFDDLYFGKLTVTQPTPTATPLPTPPVTPPPNPTITPTPSASMTPSPTPVPTVTPSPSVTPLPSPTPSPTTTPAPGNAILNPSLETGAGAIPDAWQQGKWGSNNAVFTYPVAGSHGARGAKVEMTAFTDGDAKWYFYEVVVESGKTYEISHDYLANVSTEMTLRYTLSDGSYAYQGLGTLAPAAGWTRHSARFTPPAGTVSFTAFHLLAAVGSLSIDNFALQQATSSDRFSEGMVSLSFDDGWTSHFESAKPILDSAGVKGTFYVNTQPIDEGWSGYMTWAQVLAMQAAGHEIGSHTATHARLTEISDSQLTSEVNGSRDTLIARGITDPATLAYPYGVKDARVINAVKAAGYAGARGIEWGYNTSSADRYQLLIQEVDVNTSLATVKDWIDEAKATNTWLVLMFHHIDDSGTQYGTTPAILQGIVDHLNGRQLKSVTVKEGVRLLR